MRLAFLVMHIIVLPADVEQSDDLCVARGAACEIEVCMVNSP
jgi:hypothetical protein